jgi:hypothetical protein
MTAPSTPCTFGVRERRKRPGLALDARATLRVGGHLIGQRPDRHLAPELRVARAIHHTHAARAERLQDLVGAETVAGLEGHWLVNSTLAASREPRC